jgi:hypothetical protein
MQIDQLHSPGEGQPKRSTQIISLFVGGALFILGLCGILFEGFAGLHLSPLYSTIIAFSGATLFYNGYKNNSRDAFLSCLFFTVFFGLHALAGWILGKPGTPNVGFESFDPLWLKIIPNIHELGRTDHILNTVLSFILLGGTIDWWRGNSEKGKRTKVFEDIKKDFRKDRFTGDDNYGEGPTLHH